MDLLWAESLELLEKEVSESRFRSLFMRMSPLNLSEEGVYTLGVPTKFYQRFVEKNHLDDITRTLRSVSGRDDLEAIVLIDESITTDYPVAPLPPEMIASNNDDTSSANTTNSTPTTFTINGETLSTPRATTKANPSNPFNDSRLDSKYTFSSFVVGDSNNLAYTTALAVAESPGQNYNPLFIWGGSGLGKTHLLQAIGAHIKEIYPEKRITYTTAKNFVDQYVERIMSGGNSAVVRIGEMRTHYRNTDLLLVDDVQDLEGKEGSLTQFFHTFNTLKESRKQIVIVADRSPEELEMDERFSSRFRSGLMVDIQPPTYETRCAILKNYTASLGVPFTEEAINYIAEKSSDNIREMEGAANRVVAWAGLNKQAIATLDVVTKAIMGYFPERAARPISIPSVQKEVCRYYNITHAELIGNKRKQDIVFPRHMAMYLCQELTESSLPETGKAFGGKDHTTVMHAVDKIKKKMGLQPEVYDHVQHLTKALRSKAI
jgi:chromosomal replication initiator protein